MIKSEDLSRKEALFAYLEKNRNSKKFVKSVETSASFILITFFLIFAIRPTAYTISSLLGEIKAKEILSQQKLKPKIQNVIQAQQNFALIQQDYHLIDASLPNSPSYSHLATQLLGAGYQSQLPFSKINFNFNQQTEDQKPASPFSSNLNFYQVSLNQPTRFSSALGLLNQIFNNRRLLEIAKISLSRDQQAEGITGQINLSLSLKVPFWQLYEKK